MKLLILVLTLSLFSCYSERRQQRRVFICMTGIKYSSLDSLSRGLGRYGMQPDSITKDSLK